MKVSVSLPDDDVAFVDAYAQAQGISSRSGVFQRAIRLLRANQLADDYENAWSEWENSEDAPLWESTSHDGMAPNAKG